MAADVFCDVGNKSIGISCLMEYLGSSPEDTLHIGDRFTVSGNDTAARSCCCILWIASPQETEFFLRNLLSEIKAIRVLPYGMPSIFDENSRNVGSKNE